MRHPLLLAAAAITVTLTLTNASCSSSTATSPSATASASATVPIEPGTTLTPSPPTSSVPTVPEGLPPSFEEDVPAADVPVAALIPLRAEVTGAWYGVTSAGEAIVVAWAFPGDDPLRLDRGVAAWRRFDDDGDPWRPVWGVGMTKRSRTLGVDGTVSDITGDGSDDVLLFAAIGGSGSCGSSTGVDLATGTVVFSRPEVCDAQIVPGPGGQGLVVTEAVYAEGDPHCCPSQLRTATLRYAGGQEWAVVDEQVTDL